MWGLSKTMKEGPAGPWGGGSPQDTQGWVAPGFSSCFCLLGVMGLGPCLPFLTHPHFSLGLCRDISPRSPFLLLRVTSQTRDGILAGEIQEDREGRAAPHSVLPRQTCVKPECAGVTWSLHFCKQPCHTLSIRALQLNSGLRPELATLWSDP